LRPDEFQSHWSTDAAPTVQAAWRLIFAPEASGPFFVLIVTGALAIWNVGIAFVVGLAAYWFKKQDLLRV
jgi:hypothetical protein